MSEADSSHILKLMADGNYAGFVAALGSVNDFNQRYPSNQNMTLLEYACCVDSGGQMVQKLLDSGARAEELNTRKRCRALHMAAESLNLAAIRLLLLRSDPNALTLHGDNVLHVLCRQPATDERVNVCVGEVLGLCRDRGLPLDVNHRNQSGQTPVFVAAKGKKESLVVLLLGHGCNIDCDDVLEGEEGDEDRLTARRLLLLPEWADLWFVLPPKFADPCHSDRDYIHLKSWFAQAVHPGKDVTRHIAFLVSKSCRALVLGLCRDRRLPLDVNHRNQSGQTPVFVAAKGKKESLVVLLLGHGCNIDCDDVLKGEVRHTARRYLQPPEWPEFQYPLPSEGEFKRDLFFLLYRGKEAEFVERLPGEVEANPALLYVHDGRQTLLQVAVKYKLTPAVEKLLELGADPNLTQPSELTASEDAAYRGSPEILNLLIARNAILARENHLSAMHYVIKGTEIGLKENSSAGSEIPENFKQCFDILLSHKELLNARDNNECTPLHLLVMHHFRDPYFIDKLVDAGALLGERNKSGNTPLDIMTPEELHQFLNRRIELSEPLESPKTITFDVGFLRYSDDNEIERYDCQSLVILSKSKERRCVLTHPVVACFIHMKWKAIRSFYLYFFTLFLTYSLLLGIRVSLGKYHSLENSSMVNNAIENASMVVDNVDSRNYKDILLTVLNIFLWVSLIIIAVLNAFYYSVSWDSLHSAMRCLLKAVIVILSIVLFLEICEGYWDIAIANVAILLTGAEFVLLIGDHPKLAAYVKMLKTVTWNYLKFFVWFSPLIIAFIVCFSALFHDSNKGSFYNLGYWFLRVFVMLTGEFEAVELLKEAETPFLSHVVFMMFVFFLTIVLLNLLNALAVNDTVTTNEDTQVYVNISRIEMLHHAEKVFAYLRKLSRNENPINLSFVRRVVRLLFYNCFMKLVRLIVDKFTEDLSLKAYIFAGKIIFKMNKECKWTTKSTSSSSEFTLKDKDIIKRAHNIRNIGNVDLQELLQDLIKKLEK